ncbi:hypothetical protein [Mycobacterium sp. shizuoka-1]|uniref:hypothetical protein n=1 Tax=Mycobacterium sp. shizuoka-1 TaxID=2039281 RepID=UPI000C05D66D|nr:hypothetical protein [Mycobacterium sp. shizuoka-1]GAY16155.1 hypothetical protein MSZK_28810 [Mycobacterium sp. shizuoka-1]
MDPRLSPVMVAVLVAPFILFGIRAIALDLSQSRHDRADGIVARWGDLRFTESVLIVGDRRHVRRIPLAGLRAAVTESHDATDGPSAHLVHLIVEGPGESVQHTQRYSAGSMTAARMFEILLNRASTPAAAQLPVALRWAA